MKDIIKNIVLLIIMIGIVVFLCSLLFFPDATTFGRVLVGIVIILMVLLPIKICITEIMWDYKYYRKNRPVKILHWVKYKLDR